MSIVGPSFRLLQAARTAEHVIFLQIGELRSTITQQSIKESQEYSADICLPVHYSFVPVYLPVIVLPIIVIPVIT